MYISVESLTNRCSGNGIANHCAAQLASRFEARRSVGRSVCALAVRVWREVAQKSDREQAAARCIWKCNLERGEMNSHRSRGQWRIDATLLLGISERACMRAFKLGARFNFFLVIFVFCAKSFASGTFNCLHSGRPSLSPPHQLYTRTLGFSQR